MYGTTLKRGLDSAAATIKAIASEHGALALWRGLSACVVREAIYTAGYLGLAPIATESLVKSVDYFKARFVCSLFYTTTPWFRSRRAATFRDSS